MHNFSHSASVTPRLTILISLGSISIAICIGEYWLVVAAGAGYGGG